MRKFTLNIGLSLALIFGCIGANDLSAQCPVGSIVNGPQNVCPLDFESYSSSFGATASQSWSLSGGGAIIGLSDQSSVDIQWGGNPGVYTLSLTENHNNGCEETIDYEITVEGIVSLGCNDGIQISLDGECKATITPDIMLEAPPYPESSFSVEVIDSDGNILPNAMVGVDEIGDTRIG